MLSVKKLTLHYGQSQILHDINLSAERGAVTCVMGTNGVGKTSLLKALAGVHPCSSGSIMLDSEEISILPAQLLAKRGVAYVPQGREIFPLLSVRENLETGFACLPRAERRVFDEIFELFPALRELGGRRGGDLSGGQQQQLSIARALVTKPQLLLLDEPTEGIQPNIIKQIGDVITYLRDQGTMAIVLVEQYFDFAYRLADTFFVMKRGIIKVSGTKSNLERETLLASLSPSENFHH